MRFIFSFLAVALLYFLLNSACKNRFRRLSPLQFVWHSVSFHCDTNTHTHTHTHRILRSQSSTLYRRLKNNHFRELLNGYRQSPKNLWHTINYITGRQCQRSASTISLSHLVNHFSTLFHYPGPPCELLCGPDNVTSLCNFQPVTKHDVERTLLSFASSKSPGPDGICSSELKLAAKTISGMLTILFNESLAAGEVPLDFKLGNIIPLLKPGKKDTTSPANYRGITLNSILSKALEKLVLEQIGKFLDNDQVFSESQYGFRKGRSTMDLLTAFVDDWLLAREKKLFAAVVFIDLSKAFDNVQHQTLLIMLQRYEIGGTVLKWLYNYLQGRNQRILLGNLLSDPFTSTKGVPQGSVLGPLLFNVYVSDLAAIANQHGTSLPSFADDMSMYCSRSTPEEACQVVSHAMSILNEAISSRGLAMNHDKAVSMIICPAFSEAMSVSSGFSAQPVIEYNGHCVTHVNNSRLLGVIVDDKLSWNDHVDAVCAKLAWKTGALRRTFWQLTPSARRLYFISVIQPDLEYAMSAILPSMSEFNRNRLHGAWRKAIRCAAGLGYHGSIDEAVKCVHVTKVDCRWALQFAMIVRRCHLSIAPADLCNKLSRPRHSFETRGQKSSFRPLRVLSHAGTLSISNRAPLVWNSLPASLQSADSRSKFKAGFLLNCSSHSFMIFMVSLMFGSPHRI